MDRARRYDRKMADMTSHCALLRGRSSLVACMHAGKANEVRLNFAPYKATAGQGIEQNGRNMSEAYRHTQGQVCEFLREHYGLSDVEALIILDDILLNLEAMVSDWASAGDRQCPPEWRRDRIASAILALGTNLECDSLITIAQDLTKAVEDDRVTDPETMTPLHTFVTAMRKAMPDTHRSVAD